LAVLIGWAATADDKSKFPGPTPTGFLLPNGWHLTPVGRHVEISDLPLNIHPLNGGKLALVTTNGVNQHSASLIDLAEGKVLASERARQSWFGLAVTKAEDKLWWSGGGNGFIHEFDLKGGKFSRLSKTEIDPSDLKATDVLKLADELAKKKEF